MVGAFLLHLAHVLARLLQLGLLVLGGVLAYHVAKRHGALEAALVGLSMLILVRLIGRSLPDWQFLELGARVWDVVVAQRKERRCHVDDDSDWDDPPQTLSLDDDGDWDHHRNQW